MDLTPLEADFIGDLAQDDHALYEVFHFVRLHHPGADDAEVLRLGRELIVRWIDRGWLALSETEGPRPAGGLAAVLEIIDRQGAAATYGFDDAPWLTLAPKAAEDLQWLRGAG